MSQRILITGGAGFLGSHLCDRMIEAGNEVICLDNYFTGRHKNITHLLDHPNFELLRHDPDNDGPETGDYQTTDPNGGPAHIVFDDLKLGSARTDADDGTFTFDNIHISQINMQLSLPSLNR